jgi:hypothetical protein
MSPLGELDVATGIVLGAAPGPPRLPVAPPDPVAALEAAVLPALLRGRCLVSFSGGRDSSAVLAVATHVARREGLPDPVPATNRAPGAVAAEESAWQEAVVAHLGLSDWVRLSWTDELDAVGPVARDVLARHGLLWPFNCHFHQPLLAAASGGTLLTGIGGDELFMAACRPGRGGSRPARARRAAFARAPYGVRRAVLRRRGRADFPWLTDAGRRAAAARFAAHDAAEPLGAAARLAWACGQRAMTVGTASLGAIAAAEGAAIAHPLLDPRLWSAVAGAVGARGYETRTAGMRALVGHLLPGELIARADKATFDEVFCGPASRAAAAGYDGAGASPRLVDAPALRRHFASPDPWPQALLLLQAALVESLDVRPVAGGGMVHHTGAV